MGSSHRRGLGALCEALAANLFVCLLLAGAYADVRPASTPPQTLVMELPKSSTGFPTIDGGEGQDTDRWPATLKYYLPGNPKFVCTATLVGERVVIAAAHCLPNGVKAELRLGGHGPVSLECTSQPGYVPGLLRHDIALCLSGASIKDIVFENIDLDLSRLKKDQPLFLLGYGCRDLNDITNLLLSGQLYGGLSKISSLPGSDEEHVVTQGGVAICPGDSGGAAYALSDNELPGGPRSIVGLNSGYQAPLRQSAIANFNVSAASFISAWAKDKSVAICGVDPSAANCRPAYAP